MSNVLIGIIGVILFIGLALAGALFLGPRFQETSVTSKASAMVSMLKQTADAANLANVTEGRTPLTNDAVILTPGYLKTVPVNPSWIAQLQPNNYILKIRLDENIGPNSDNRGGTAPASYVVGVVGVGDDAVGRAVCQKIADQFNGGIIQTDVLKPTQEAGCAFMSGYFYIAWQRI